MEVRALSSSEVEDSVTALAVILCECVADGVKVLVRPQFQRQGIAKALMLEVERMALEIGRDSCW